jgi:hypothetical protein
MVLRLLGRRSLEKHLEDPLNLKMGLGVIGDMTNLNDLMNVIIYHLYRLINPLEIVMPNDLHLEMMINMIEGMRRGMIVKLPFVENMMRKRDMMLREMHLIDEEGQCRILRKENRCREGRLEKLKMMMMRAPTMLKEVYCHSC